MEMLKQAVALAYQFLITGLDSLVRVSTGLCLEVQIFVIGRERLACKRGPSLVSQSAQQCLYEARRDRPDRDREPDRAMPVQAGRR